MALLFLASACGSTASGGASRTPEPTSDTPPEEVALLCKRSTPKRADVVEFEKGMPRPKFVRGSAPKLREEILEKGLEGTVVLKCVVTKEGAVEDCCILKGINGLNATVFEAVRDWRYEPVVLNSEPVNVSYVIQIKIMGERRQVVPFPPPR